MYTELQLIEDHVYQLLIRQFIRLPQPLIKALLCLTLKIEQQLLNTRMR